MPFDLRRLEAIGQAVPALEGVAANPTIGYAQVSVSTEGTLVYVPGGAPTGRSAVWVDRRGREEPIKAPPRAYVYPRISPD